MNRALVRVKSLEGAPSKFMKALSRLVALCDAQAGWERRNPVAAATSQPQTENG
jgi:hypothetical protein